MKTNLDKWNYYKGIIDAREHAYVAVEITDIPKAFYKVYPNGSIGEKLITKVTYNNGKYFSFNKRPTKIDVQKVKEFSETNDVLIKGNIRFNYEEIHSSGGKSSGSVSIKDSESLLSKEEAEKKSIEVKDKNAHEKMLLNNGHIRCAYCKKVVPKSESISYKIISYANYGSAGKTNTYCSGACGSYDQMAHEG